MTDPLRKALEKGDRGGVFFLYGQDEHRKAETASAVVAAHLDEGTRDFNLDTLRGGEVDVETLASIIATPPMMAEWRVVFVRGAEAFAGSPKMRELLVRTAENPPPGLALVLLATVPSGSKAKFYPQMAKLSRSVEFKALAMDDVPGWLMNEAEERFSKPLASDAARALASALGNDLGILSQELEKLAEVAGDTPEITLDVVRAAGTQLPSQDRWEWFDLVGHRQFDKAVDRLGVLLAQGETGVGLTMALTSHVLRLGVLVEDGPAALEAALPPNQKWLVRRGSYGAQAKKWEASEVARALLGLRRVDRLLKSSPLPPEHHIEEWLLSLRTRAEAAA